MADAATPVSLEELLAAREETVTFAVLTGGETDAGTTRLESEEVVLLKTAAVTMALTIIGGGDGGGDGGGNGGLGGGGEGGLGAGVAGQSPTLTHDSVQSVVHRARDAPAGQSPHVEASGRCGSCIERRDASEIPPRSVALSTGESPWSSAIPSTGEKRASAEKPRTMVTQRNPAFGLLIASRVASLRLLSQKEACKSLPNRCKSGSDTLVDNSFHFIGFPEFGKSAERPGISASDFSGADLILTDISRNLLSSGPSYFDLYFAKVSARPNYH